MQFRATDLVFLFASAAVVAAALPAAAAPSILHASFLGGPGDENVAGVAITSDGGFVVAGQASPGLGGAAARDLAGGGAGFVARFAADATKLAWIARLPEPIHAVHVDGKDVIYLAGAKHAYVLASGGDQIVATSPELPADATDLAIAGDTVGVVAGSWAIALGAAKLDERFRVDLKRSRVSSVAVDAKGGLYVGGDNNTNTGFEPYRSPFVLHLPRTGGDVDARLYDWPGPAVRDGVQLQADSRVDDLTIDPKGQLWFGGGSDGGNTVLAKPASNLKAAGQPALDGACYAGPCFNYKGAKHTGMFARIKPDFSDMERGTWYVPYYNAQSGSTQSPVTMPCGCKGPPLSPNSLTVGGIAFPGDVVAVTGNAGGSIPESADAWFPSAEGSAYLALFDRDLKTVSFSSFIPGTAGGVTANQPRIDARGSRVVIVGNAGSENAAGQPADPADHKVRFQTTKGAFQPAYGGGDRDGFVLVACLGSDGCGGPVPPLGSGAGAPPAAGSGAAGSSSVAGAAGGSAAAGASAGNSGGTSAGASGGRAGSTGSGGASGSSDDARAGASGCRVAGTGGDAAAALLALALGWIVRRGRKHGRRTNA